MLHLSVLELYSHPAFDPIHDHAGIFILQPIQEALCTTADERYERVICSGENEQPFVLPCRSCLIHGVQSFDEREERSRKDWRSKRKWEWAEWGEEVLCAMREESKDVRRGDDRYPQRQSRLCQHECISQGGH